MEKTSSNMSLIYGGVALPIGKSVPRKERLAIFQAVCDRWEAWKYSTIMTDKTR